MKTTTLGLCALLFFSCTQEDFPGQAEGGTPCDYICFGLSPDGVAQTRGGARADADGYTSGRFVLRSADSADTLCVRTVVTDGIAGAEKAVTRGTPVSDLTTYGTFHVVCDRDDMPNAFFMDVDVTEKSGGLWGTEPTYYWPGAGPTLTFYAWAPGDVYTNPTKDLTFTYTVPDAAADQKDLLVAKTAALDGDYNQAVDLAFDHICTAVKFVVGSEMQAGTIESVTLKGVYNKGTYDMTTAEWDLTNSPLVDFTQTLDIQTDGNETDGTAITTPEGTFMMLPQTLPDGATVEVVFTDGVTGTDRTLSATIEGSDWPQGKTVTYKLSVTPEYELEFISEPELQDAHYVIYPIHIKAQDVPGGEWTMTSPDSKVTLRTELTTLTRRGFWIVEDRGAQTISSTTTGDDITVYAFLEENATDAQRDVILELRPANMSNATPATFTISQLCPSWNGNLGCERIEEYDEGYDGYPWGFLWDDNLEISYEMGGALSGNLLLKAAVFFYINLFSDNPWVHDNGIIGGLFNYTVTFDFSQISSLDVALSESDGWQNTLDIYNFDGLNDASSMMQMLEEWGYSPEPELPSNPTVFAARACALKNKFNKEEGTEDGQQVERAVLKEENLVWYLPAANEAPQMKDDEYPLSGDYWTSTAIDDNQNAYKYTVGGSTAEEIRTRNLHVRAVRKKP